jgi:hypothetical protein
MVEIGLELLVVLKLLVGGRRWAVGEELLVRLRRMGEGGEIHEELVFDYKNIYLGIGNIFKIFNGLMDLMGVIEGIIKGY